MGIAQSAIGAQKPRPNAGTHSRPALLVRAAGFGVAKRPVMPLSECRSVRTMREYGAIRLSATGRSAAAACSGSRHRPASRGQVIIDDLAHHHLARVAFPSGPRPRWCGRSPARHRCRPPPGCGRPEHTPGRTSPPGGAGGQAGRRAVQPAAHGGLLAGKLALGVRADAGQGRQRISPCCHADAGSWAPIRSGHCSSTWRGRRARTGRPGMSCCGLRVIPVDRTTTDVPDNEKNAWFGPSR